MGNKKEALQAFSLIKTKKPTALVETNPEVVEKAVNEIHKKEESITIQKPTSTKISSSKAIKKSSPKKQSVVNVQVPTPKDLYIEIKSLLIDRDDIKGIKYLYLDAVEYYLKNKIYDQE